VLGQGALAVGVTQMVDKALMERMFAAGSAKAAGEVLDRAYNDLELLIGSLAGSGIPELLSAFNGALHDLSATPNDRPLRDFVILKADALARELRSLYQSAADLQGNVNGELVTLASSINEKTAAIAKLNVLIAGAEGGGVLGSDASGLREQRYALIEQLSELVEINIQEQNTGAISVFVGGDYLVTDGSSRAVYAHGDRGRADNWRASCRNTR
jgi:flagellar hook-associated protein 1